MAIKNSTEKKNGIVYTPSHLADFVAKQLLSVKKPNTTGLIKIFDPAIGEGELVISLLSQIYEVNQQVEVSGFDTDKSCLEITNARIKKQFPEVITRLSQVDFVEDCLSDSEKQSFDYIIVNPPYVRTQELGSKQSQKLSKDFKLTGRVDLYYIFLIGVRDYLKQDGAAGFIVSNKFMSIKAGKSLRDFIITNYQLEKLFDLGDTDLFDAAVLPALLFFSKGKTNAENVDYDSVYKSIEDKDAISINSLYSGFGTTQTVKFGEGYYSFESGVLEIDPAEGNWILLTDERKKWFDKIEKNCWNYFGGVGKIRVGIKTTADNVFIGETFPNNIELLRPLITHRSSGQFNGDSNANWQVLYTHYSENGKRKAYDLEKYPNAKSYLQKHYEQLSSRSYIKKANRNWYEIWVPQNPDSWKKKKIVFRDITETPEFWIDETGAIVNGDCYWIDFDESTNPDVIYLMLGIANSSFIERYYDVKFRTKLYSGKRRFITQYVEKFPIPWPYSTESQQIINSVREILTMERGPDWDNKKAEIDLLVNRCFEND